MHPVPCALHSVPCTLYSPPRTIHPVPCAPHPAPRTLHPVPCTLHAAPFTLHPVPCAPHPAPCTLYSVPCTLYPVLSTLHPIPVTPHPLIHPRTRRPSFTPGLYTLTGINRKPHALYPGEARRRILPQQPDRLQDEPARADDGGGQSSGATQVARVVPRLAI
jgi:hypothetical protein